MTEKKPKPEPRMLMKIPLKLKILLYLKAKIEAVPEGEKPSKWLIRACLIVTWFINLPKKIERIKDWILSRKIVMYFDNLYFIFSDESDTAKIFTGWGYRWFAKKYADKRANISRVNEVCGCKRHYAIEYGKGALIVINKTEMNRLKTKHLFRKSYNILDVLENAYYVTKERL